MGATGIVLTLGVAAMVLLLGGLLVYMSQLMKNAYQIKVELQSELDAGLHRVDEEADKKLKWIKRDTFEELEKAKAALTADHTRRMNEMQEMLNKRLQERDELWKRERTDLLKILEQHHENIKVLDQRLRTLRREQRRADLMPLPDGMPTPDADQIQQLLPPTEAPMESGEELAQAAPA